MLMLGTDLVSSLRVSLCLSFNLFFFFSRIVLGFLVRLVSSRAGLPSRESVVDKPAPSREADIEAHKNAKLFGENPRFEAFVEAVSKA